MARRCHLGYLYERLLPIQYRFPLMMASGAKAGRSRVSLHSPRIFRPLAKRSRNLALRIGSRLEFGFCVCTMENFETLTPGPEWRPPAPIPCEKPLGLFALLHRIFTNPLEAWTTAHFKPPAVATRLLGTKLIVINEPSAIRRVLRESLPRDRAVSRRAQQQGRGHRPSASVAKRRLRLSFQAPIGA